MTIYVKPIKPKKVNPEIGKIYYDTMRAGVREFANKVLADYRKIKRTWVNKPMHKSEIQCSQQFPEVAVMFGATGDDQAVKEWNFVNEGTRVRHAVMSKDWKSKSTVKHIGASQGKGNVIFISKKINLPGIEARKFDEAISEKWNPRWKTTVIKAMKEARKQSGM